MDIKVAIGSWESPPTINGPANYIKELAERLANYVDVTLLVPNTCSLLDKNGLSVKKIPSINIPIVRVCQFSLHASLALKKLNIDIVHDNGVLGFSDFSPFIETWHHSTIDDKRFRSKGLYYLSSYRERLTLKGLKKANSIIAISTAAKKELIEKYDVDSSKIFVVPHGVDTDFFKPLSMNSLVEFHKFTNKITFLYIGSLSDRKNLFSLIQAIGIVSKKHSNIQLLISGIGNELSRLKHFTVDLGLQSKVIFLGLISRSSLPELYNIADFVVLPSYTEGFGMTVLEGLACEKPVIMTPVGISDIVENNNLGIVSDDFSSISFANAIEKAIIHKFDNTRSYVARNFRWDLTLQKTLQLYITTLNRSNY